MKVTRLLGTVAALAFLCAPVHAADESRSELETLVRSYYRALAAEDLEAVALLLHLTDEDAAKAELLRHSTVFRAMDLTIDTLEVGAIELDEAGAGGIVHARVVATVAKADGSDAFVRDSDAVLIVARTDGVWRIVRATTQARLAVARKLIPFREAAGSVPELMGAEDATEASGVGQPWLVVVGLFLALALLATRLRVFQRLLGALLVAPLLAGAAVAVGQVALGGSVSENHELTELWLRPWTLWQEAQVWLPGVAWAAAGLAGGLIVARPLMALVAGILIPLGPWLLVRAPTFDGWPTSPAGVQAAFERLADGSSRDLLTLVVVTAVGALFGGLLASGPRGGPATQVTGQPGPGTRSR